MSPTSDDVRRLPDADALRTAAGDDVYVRTSLDDDATSYWAGPGSALAWIVPGRRFPGRGHLIVTGDAPDAAALASRVLAELADGVTSMSLPRDSDRLVRPAVRLDPRNAWEWMYADAAPPGQAREDEVGWLGDEDAGDILALLTAWSGRHDAVPGDEEVVGWAGVRDVDGALIAVAAQLEYHRGVPFLASIATAGEARGRGYGAAVTAWTTRQALASHDLVALGMYSDNDVARRMYLRLGYRIDKRWTSGRLVRPGSPALSSPAPPGEMITEP